mmetsp:Transcript_63669/g.182891  ORF Transcript_63669/g.182891 Transcript_63669/m.182891 type:complete len:223 (-) Transcript_63669:96-764(-)
MHVDTFCLQQLVKMGAHVLVEASQRLLCPEHEVHLASVAVEEASKLNGNVATPDDDDLVRPLRQRQRLVTSQDARQVRSRDLGHDRAATGGHANVLARDSLAVDLDGVGVDDASVALEDIHLGTVQHVPVDAVQPRDLAVLRLQKLRPVDRGSKAAWKLPTVAHGILHVLMQVAPVDEQLFRNAPSDHASAAQTSGTVFAADEAEGQLRQCHLGAVVGGAPS